MKLEILEPPAGEIVTLDEAKRFARMHLDLDDDDAMVEGLIKSARELIEARLARCFLATKIRETRVIPESGRIRLSRYPIAMIESVTIDGEPVDPAPETPPPSGLVGNPGETWVVTYTAGVADVADVPETAKTVVKMLAAHWRDRRTPTSRDAQNLVPLHVDALCDALRWGGEIPR